jgi:phage shock protein PspC (stress-responsive transcriptional regulator)
MSMRKVITINLNGCAYQVDEPGYLALSQYLDRAARQLAGNPDAAEIITDLEQAIGDKCDTFLGAHKNVVTAEEVETILHEMGPVEPAGVDARAAGAGAADTPPPSAEPPPRSAGNRRPRKLYRLPELGKAGGVCAGLAAYFDIDVVWVRLGFVLLTLVTGIGVLLWLVMLLIVPAARTDEEKAAACGADPSDASPCQPSRRLFRIPEAGKLGGVCAGIAAYFNMEVVLVRVVFVLLAVLTGVGLIAWLALLCLMPVARTPEDYAAAHGEPFNARDVIDRVNKKAREAASAAAGIGEDLKRGFQSMKRDWSSTSQDLRDDLKQDRAQRRRQRQFRRWQRRRHEPVSFGAQVAAGISLPILSVLSAVLFVGFIVALFALLGHGAIAGWQPLPLMPRWIPIVALLVIYGLVAGPIGAARRASHRYANGGTHTGWASALDGLLWIGLVTLLLWGLFHYVPWIQDVFQGDFPWWHHREAIQTVVL